ncbi:SufD family Fe-S cluster assembly protein [Peptoniphilus sp. AGMB00490]|uniref:SufD family Fe-S cluster assembly protein n=1 Tax=Peptoniphilus faecalis TaxID=2731255 RepID=A0A848RFF6_9FIRM|nr:SufD family Fe-S cluster assembly protein [Peptoniphilus faecalis]NMW85550.1 SufD family Fe-S cluster assembly protein [Peptoniphilus faecalis]
MNIIGNEIAFKTFSFLKVNETEIKIPKIRGKLYREEGKKNPGEISEFEKIKYGISSDALELNRKYLNYYNSYVAKEGEVKEDFKLFELDDEYCELFDLQHIIAEKNSKLKVILDYTSCGKGEKFRNSVIKVLAKENSQVEVFVIARDDDKSLVLESIGIYTEDDAKVSVHQYELGASKLYTNYKAELIGERSSSVVDSIYFGQKEEYLNMNYDMIHRGKKTESDILVNGALKDKSFKNFKSNLQFIEGAKGAVGSEEEYSILLDDTVNSISVPLMLAHEDDVVGNHASSAGKLDMNQVFYLMSRGISYDEAEALIVESKFSRAIDALADEKLKEEVWNSVRQIIKRGN